AARCGSGRRSRSRCLLSANGHAGRSQTMHPTDSHRPRKWLDTAPPLFYHRATIVRAIRHGVDLSAGIGGGAMWNTNRTDTQQGIVAGVQSFVGGNGDLIHAYVARPEGTGPY